MGPDLNETCTDDTGMPCVSDPSSTLGGMILTFKRVHEDSDPAVSSEHVLTPNGASKRLIQMGQADCESDDEQNLLRALRHRPWRSYHEWETSSEDESDSEQINSAARASALPVGVLRGCSQCEGCQKVIARWKPEAGCRPCLEEAPVFFPLEEEFRDTMKYIASISAEAEQYGICRIVPPHSWRPPCPLKDSDKRQTAKFPTRVQQLDKLQVREVQAKKLSRTRKRRRGRPRKDEYMGRRSLMFGESCTDTTVDSSDEQGKFGFEPGPKFTLEAFEKYAHQFREEYFGLREHPEVCSESKVKCEPSVENIEGEYWRILEHATEQIEVLYGADVETREFGSGFPKAKPDTEPTCYENSGWNLNNIARIPGSVLSFEEAEISGVLVPWLYVGMCFSSFCWHVEDHHFYSLNYMHFGSPKVWYGVPGSAAHELEDAMKKHLPELFEEQPDLLHKLVTQLSPSVLKEAGVPVYRAVQKPGEFVVTFPRAYHAGFNCGFNCAEAVNVAPVDWLPHGQNAVELYREQRRRSSVSHDKLLIGAAEQAVRTLLHRFPGVKAYEKADLNVSAWQESFGQDDVLIKALKKRVELERARRTSINNMIHVRKMDRSFDAIHERECSICRYDLHLSAVGCKCVPERYSCLEHVRQLCACEQTKKFALYRYELSELDTLVEALEGQTCAVTRWLEIEQSLSLKSSSFSGSELSTHFHNELNTSSGICQNDNENSRAACDSGPHDHTFMPQSTIRVSLLPESTVRIVSPDPMGRLPVESAWNVEGKQLKKVKPTFNSPLFPQHAESGLLFCGQNVEVSNKAKTSACESRPRREKLPKPSIIGHFKTEDNRCAEQQIFPPLTFHGQVAGVKRDVEVIVLSDEEDDVIGRAFPSASCGTRFAHGSGNSERLENGLSLNEVPAAPLLKQDGNMCWSAEQGVNLHHFSDERAMDPLPYHFTGLGDNGSKKRDDVGASMDWLCNRGLQPSLSQPIGGLSAVGKGSSQQLMAAPPAKLAVSMEEAKEYEVRSSKQTLTTVVGKRSGNVEYSFHGYPSLSLQEERVYKVDLLNAGRLVLRKSWSNKHAIFPAGFRSRVLFPSILDPFQACFYISEVLDLENSEPLFKVMMENHPSEVFVHPSIDRCWQMVQERVNMTIHLRHDLGKMRLHFLRPPEDIRGIEMFGFTTPHIIKAVELMDWRHQCIEYWAGRLSAIELLENQHQAQVSLVNGADSTGRNGNFMESFMMVPLHSSQRILETAAISFNPMKGAHNV